jgi:hypothetical protein
MIIKPKHQAYIQVHMSWPRIAAYGKPNLCFKFFTTSLVVSSMEKWKKKALHHLSHKKDYFNVWWNSRIIKSNWFPYYKNSISLRSLTTHHKMQVLNNIILAIQKRLHTLLFYQ